MENCTVDSLSVMYVNGATATMRGVSPCAWVPVMTSSPAVIV